MPDDLELKALDNFIGSESYYNVFGVKVTDGVNYIMANGYSWFVTDAILAVKFIANLKAEPHLTIELKLIEPKKADMVITDGNGNELYKQHYDYTTAKRELKLFLIDNVLILNSEY